MISIDASVFLGMHCSDDSVRIACKNLVANNLTSGILISLEEVGRCDNEIWKFPNASQDSYFKFMDRLMSQGNFIRESYDKLQSTGLKQLPLRYALTKSHAAPLYTYDKGLLKIDSASVLIPEKSRKENSFALSELENLYLKSRKIFLEFKLLSNLF